MIPSRSETPTTGPGPSAPEVPDEGSGADVTETTEADTTGTGTTGTKVIETQAVGTQATDADVVPAGSRIGWWRRWWVRVGAACVVPAVAGGVLLYQAHALRTAASAENRALTDVAATGRLNGDVATALAKAFSYTPGGTQGTERSAREVLAGKAARQYTQLFGQVRENVRRQKVALTTQTVRVGTVSLRGDTAQLLVFLDQTARRGKEKPATSAAQLSVTAQLRDDEWRIVEIKAR